MFTLSDVKALLDQGEAQDILSLYLNVDNAVSENQATNPAWRIWLKQHIRNVDKHIHDDAKADWEAIRERTEAFFQEYTPSSKGLVAFFGPDWERIHALPLPIENQAAFGKPLVGPLLWALDEYHPYLVVVVDSEEGRFYESYLGQTAFRDSIEIDLESYDFAQKTGMPSGASIPGGHSGVQLSNRDSFDDMIQEHRMRFYREVAEHARRIAEQDGIERIILGGDEQIGHTVKKQLPQAQQQQVVDIVSIPRHYSTHEIFEHVQPLALAYERKAETELIDDVIDTARAGGRAILGPEAVDHALTNAQVSHLILAWPPDDQDGANDLAYRALQLNSQITMVHGEPADKLRTEGGGVAARLYYTT